jgi:hypothetical protein
MCSPPVKNNSKPHLRSCVQSYLELISLYKTLLAQKRENLARAKDRLVSGVEKIAQASAQVEDLQKNLVEEQKIVAEKKEKTGALIEAIGKEKVQVCVLCWRKSLLACCIQSSAPHLTSAASQT